jgi:hypothetical protein
MSVKLATLVRKFGPTDHTDFVVLLALADHANDSGGDCWPSVKAVATEMRIGERSVARSLSVLENDGWISVLRRSRDHKGNSYQLIIAKLVSHATEAGEQVESDATVAGENVTSHATEAGETREVTCQPRQSDLPMTTESPAKSAFPLIGTVLNHPEPSQRAQARVLPDLDPVVERCFALYCKLFGRNPRKYTLTKTKRQKAASRMRERLKVHRGDLAEVERECIQCIQNLAASEWHRANGQIDWTDRIFASTEEFEKRLNWKPATKPKPVRIFLTDNDEARR